MVSRLAHRSLDEGTSADQAALVRGLVAGSDRAWREFHARYDGLIRGAIGRVAMRRAPRLSEDDVREIYATFLAQLCANDMSKLRSFDGTRGSRLSSWLGVLAYNFAIDYRRGLHGERDHAALDEIEDEVLAETPTPEEALDRKERLAIASEVLGALPERDRELFTLYFDEELLPEQIAARMQISVNTVYSKKHKIQSRFEARLAEPLAA